MFCQSSLNSGKDKNIEADVKDAIIKCMDDKRYGSVLRKEDMPNVELVFTFLFNKTELTNHTFAQLNKDIELGVHAIEIENNGKHALFGEYIPIMYNYDLRRTLERLSETAELNRSSYLNNETHIYRYDVFTFKGNRKKEIVDLYRYNIPIDIKQVNGSSLINSVVLARNWYNNNSNPYTNLIEYEYYPAQGKYSKSDNHLRRIATIWAMTKISDFLKDDSLNQEIESNLKYYQNYISEQDGYLFASIDGKALLSYNAFLILAILNINDYPDRSKVIKQLADGILSAQKNDGSFYTDIKLKVVDKDNIDYYPGEALLALMQVYNYNKDPIYLNSVKKGFIYYKYYWENNKNKAFIPWHTQAYYLLYNITKDEEIPEFIFEMNDWLIKNNQITASEYADEIGGMPHNDPSCSTSSYLEGINDAYILAKAIGDKQHEKMYMESLILGSRFILQTQYNDRNVFFLRNPNRAIGGFRQTLTKNTIRNDYVQHAVIALIKVYDNHIFEKNVCI